MPATRNVSLCKSNKSFVQTPKTYKYSIIIPAAGMGVRMKSYGAKSLIEIAPDLTVLDNQLNIIRNQFKQYEIILVAGFEIDRIIKHIPQDIILIENERYEETNVCKSIGMGLKAATTDRIIIIYGDLVFTPQAFDIKLNKGSTIWLDPSHTMTLNEVGCTYHNGYLEQICYELPVKWAQISFFTGQELEKLQKITYNKDNEKLYGFEVINQIIDNGGSFRVVAPDGLQANDIDGFKDIKVAQEIINSNYNQ